MLIEEYLAENGLGAGGETFVNVTNALTDAANAAANIVAATKGNQSPTGGTTYSPVIYQPPQTQPAQTQPAQTQRDYLPWIIGGGVLLIGAIFLLKK